MLCARTLETAGQSDSGGSEILHDWSMGSWSALYDITKNLKSLPDSVAEWMPLFVSARANLARNVCSTRQRDSHNAQGSWNLVVPCSQFQGGEIWVQNSEGGTLLPQHAEPATLWETCFVTWASSLTLTWHDAVCECCSYSLARGSSWPQRASQTDRAVCDERRYFTHSLRCLKVL